jgi:hypothetical protein
MKLQKIDEIAHEDLNLTHSQVPWVTYKKLNEIKWNSQMGGETGTNWVIFDHLCINEGSLFILFCSSCWDPPKHNAQMHS